VLTLRREVESLRTDRTSKSDPPPAS
jgi:hypothetical protein